MECNISRNDSTSLATDSDSSVSHSAWPTCIADRQGRENDWTSTAVILVSRQMTSSMTRNGSTKLTMYSDSSASYSAWQTCTADRQDLENHWTITAWILVSRWMTSSMTRNESTTSTMYSDSSAPYSAWQSCTADRQDLENWTSMARILVLRQMILSMTRNDSMTLTTDSDSSASFSAWPTCTADRQDRENNWTSTALTMESRWMLHSMTRNDSTTSTTDSFSSA